MIIVEVRKEETSQPIVHEAINTYTKGPLFCVYLTTGKVKKYPIMSLFDITEDYKDND